MTFTTSRRIEFRDTDAAGIAHFSVFFTLMESVEHEFLRTLGLSVLPGDVAKQVAGTNQDEVTENTPRSHGVTWPRVAAHCDYQAVARFEDVLEIELGVKRLGASSVAYEFRFSRAGTAIARGDLTVVACFLSPGGGLEKTPIPEAVRGLLGRFVVA